MAQALEVGKPPKLQPEKTRPQKHYRVAAFDLPKFTFSARLIDETDELEQLIVPWNRLTETSIRNNPFFDPDFLIPAFRHLNDGNVKVLVVEAPKRVCPDGPTVICGLFPIHAKRMYGFPLSCLEIWKHDQCFDCTPLIRKDCAPEVLEFILGYLGRQLNTSLFSMNCIAGEGAIANLLSDCFRSNFRTIFHRDQFNRSCFKPMADAETFINSRVAKNTRKGTLRLRRKLATLGNVETNFSISDEMDWIREFVELESTGWKGKSGTALASQQSTQQFFVEMAERMLQLDKLTITRTSLNGKPISMICDLRQQNQAAHFKTAFDESLSNYSPGLIAELDHIHYLHDKKIAFVDSCADPSHSMINRVWPDRVRFQSIVVALRGPVSKFAVASMPMIQLFSKLLPQQRKTT